MSNENTVINKLIKQNQQLSEDATKIESDFFSKHAYVRNPKYVWIGCSDSRVCPEQMLGLKIGEIFVHRGVGNVVDKNDISLMGFIYFAVNNLGIKNIIICGHYNCALVEAAAREEQCIDPFVKEIKQKVDEVRNKHSKHFNTIDCLEQKNRYLVEKNVEEQVTNFKQLEFIQNKLPELEINGIVYDVGTGLIHKISSN